MTARAEPIVGLGLALLLGACSRDPEPVRTAPETAPVAAAPTPGMVAAPARPEGADAVDAAVAGVRAFNAQALVDLAAIETAETRFRTMGQRALEAARRSDWPRATAARSEAEAARVGLVEGLARLQTSAAEQTAAVDAALALCAPQATGSTAPLAPLPPVAGSGGLAAYAGCVALPAEKAQLDQNVAALTNRYAAAEAAYARDRGPLEEAAVTIALNR